MWPPEEGLDMVCYGLSLSEAAADRPPGLAMTAWATPFWSYRRHAATGH